MGLDLNCSERASSDRLDAVVAGWYEISFSVHFETGVAETFDFSVFVNGVEQAQIAAQREFTGSAPVGSTGASGLAYCDKNDAVELRVKALNAGRSVSYARAQLHMKLVA